jgi:hypothetical protein
MAAGALAERRQHKSTRGAKKQLPRNDSGRLWQNVGSLQPLCLTDPASAFSESHGGLTPAALVGMRMCIAKIGFSSADFRTATEERGA